MNKNDVDQLLTDCTLGELLYLKERIGSREIEIHHSAASQLSEGSVVQFELGGVLLFGKVSKVHTFTVDVTSFEGGTLCCLKAGYVQTIS